MIVLLVLTLLIAFAIGATIRAMVRGDRPATPPPASHRVDPTTLPPSRRAEYHHLYAINQMHGLR